MRLSSTRIFFVVLAALIAEIPAIGLAAALNPTSLATLTNSTLHELIETVGIGFDHRPYRQATPLGYKLGVDIGVEVGAIQISQKLQSDIQKMGVTSSVPIYVPYVKLNGAKGLPWGIDISGSYVSYKSDKIWGLGAQWSFLKDKKEHHGIAIRAAMNRASLFIINVSTYSGDLVASTRLFYALSPYIGLGYQYFDGDLRLSVTNTIPGLPSSIDKNYARGYGRAFVGLPINLLILRTVINAEYSLSGMYQVGLKIGINL